MATHRVCPRDKGKKIDDIILIGTALQAVRCKMINEGRCMSDGMTSGSLFQYCKDCSAYYGICEVCGDSMQEVG